MPIDESWLRDSWPIFVTRPDGTLAVSDYAFNSRGEKCPPCDNDAAVGRRLAEHFGVERFAAPMVLGEAHHHRRREHADHHWELPAASFAQPRANRG